MHLCTLKKAYNNLESDKASWHKLQTLLTLLIKKIRATKHNLVTADHCPVYVCSKTGSWKFKGEFIGKLN